MFKRGRMSGSEKVVGNRKRRVVRKQIGEPKRGRSVTRRGFVGNGEGLQVKTTAFTRKTSSSSKEVLQPAGKERITERAIFEKGGFKRWSLRNEPEKLAQLWRGEIAVLN